MDVAIKPNVKPLGTNADLKAMLAIHPEISIPKWAWSNNLWFGVYNETDLVGYGSIQVDHDPEEPNPWNWDCDCHSHLNEYQWDDPKQLSLHAIHVKESERGKGYGRQLVGALIAISQDMKAEFLTLEVDRTNEVARHLYESLGFGDTGRRMSDDPQIHMERTFKEVQ